MEVIRSVETIRNKTKITFESGWQVWFKEDLYAAGLWGFRLLFSTESARECVEVAKGHLGYSDYRPNVLTRGLYYRGVE